MYSKFKKGQINKDNAIHACGVIEDMAFEIYPDSPIDGEIALTSARITEAIIKLNNERTDD